MGVLQAAVVHYFPFFCAQRSGQLSVHHLLHLDKMCLFFAYIVLLTSFSTFHLTDSIPNLITCYIELSFAILLSDLIIETGFCQ